MLREPFIPSIFYTGFHVYTLTQTLKRFMESYFALASGFVLCVQSLKLIKLSKHGHQAHNVNYHFPSLEQGVSVRIMDIK